jgi:hypothetical protein
MMMKRAMIISRQITHRCRRWETGKTGIPKPSEFLLRLLYREHANNQHGKISSLLRKIADLEDTISDEPILFVDTKEGWRSAV